jgi:hypothetical protein
MMYCLKRDRDNHPDLIVLSIGVLHCLGDGIPLSMLDIFLVT